MNYFWSFASSCSSVAVSRNNNKNWYMVENCFASTNNELFLEFCFKLLKCLLIFLSWKQPTEDERMNCLKFCIKSIMLS